MSSVQSRIGSELHYIYVILRRLKAIRRAEFKRGSATNPIGLEVTLFSRKFLAKLLEERLSALEAFAEELVTRLFKRLGNKNKTKQSIEGSDIKPIKSNSLKSGCHELDEFFHYSLYYLYDFIIELDWHESDTNWTTSSDLSKSAELVYVDNFLHFRRALNTLVKKLHTTNNDTASKLNNASSEPGSLKSSLSRTKSGSPGRKRHVKFKDSLIESTISEAVDSPSDKDRRDAQSTFALDMLVYAMNLFIQQLSNRLAEFATGATDLKDLLLQIKDSKKKISTAQLNVISRKIKNSNDVYLTILEFLFDLRKTYMIDYVLNILCAQDSDGSLDYQRAPRIGIFVQKIEFDIERKLIERLANQSFQLLIDLICSEISLPPLELNAETETKSREEVVRSRENYSNFITSWLNIDDVIFGSALPKRRSRIVDLKAAKQKTQATKHSTLSTGGRFKSSSRILAQMDNLNELARDFFEQILDRMQSVQQIKYFLELLHLGFEESFETISKQISLQLVSFRQKGLEKALSRSQLNNFSAVSNNIDLISAKVRSLKLIHIMSSIDKLIKEVAIQHRIELSERSLDSKLTKFIDKCGQQTHFSSK